MCHDLIFTNDLFYVSVSRKKTKKKRLKNVVLR